MKHFSLRSLLVPVVLVLPLAATLVLTAASKKESEEFKLTVPLGLDQQYEKWVPADNPLTAAKVELGKLLYFDPRLSADGTVSCASCHHPDYGYSNGVQFSPGVKGKLGGRNSPTTLNRLHSAEQFWDGRVKSLEDQALGPVANPVEMANTIPSMVTTLKNIKGYKPYFKKAFASPEITPERVAMALASFERTLLTGNSPFDRFQAGDAKAMSESALRGMTLFVGKANCNDCHTLPAFTDEKYHNVGVGMDKSNPDFGRFNVTRDEKDKGCFKTPTLRQIAETYPYLHDGSVRTLEEVVELYNCGGVANPNLDQKLKPLGLKPEEKQDLVSFLKALSGDAPKIATPALPM